MEQLESILSQLLLNKSEDELRDIKQCEEKAKELCKSMQDANQQIEEISQEIEEFKIKELEMHEIMKTQCEKICALKLKIANLQQKYDALSKIRKESFDNACGNFKQEADIATAICNNMMDQFDFKIKVTPIQTEIWEIKYIFIEGKEITLHYNIKEKYFDLQSMVPTHPRFSDMKTFLNDSSDITGFLYCARKFFMAKQ